MIALASDHAGFQYKQKIKELLSQLGLEFQDFGTMTPDPCDYPDFGHAGAEAVGTGKADRGILICGTGIGMSIVANKSDNVRASLCVTEEMARVAREHNNANVLCLGGRTNSWETTEKIVRMWLSTPFEGGRHERRVEKIHSLTHC